MVVFYISIAYENMETLNKPDNDFGWSTLSDPLLIMIFKKLDVKDVVSSSTVCCNWNSICQDNLLWKYLFRRDFIRRKRRRRTKGIHNDEGLRLKNGATSWKEEYIRLTEGYPCIKQQTLTGHTDEVLHVAFSHNGAEIASCSKVSSKLCKSNVNHFIKIPTTGHFSC